jgi:hypothetical protein
MKKSQGLLVALACVACQAADKNTSEIKALPIKPVEPTSVVTEAKSFSNETYVALWSGSILYRSPNEDSQKATMAFVSKRSVSGGDAVVMRLHREIGEFFEVEPLTSEQNQKQCYYKMNNGLSGLGVKLFVKKTDAIPVLSQPMSFSYPDKTSIELQEGILAQPSTPNTYLLSDGVYSFESSLEEGSTALWFSLSSSRLGPFSAEEEIEISQIVIGDKTFLNTPENLWGKTVELQSKERLFLFGTNCSKYQALFPKKKHQEFGGMLGGLLGALGPEKKYKIASGAAIYWPDKSNAGETRDELRVEKPTASTKERTCFEVPLNNDLKFFNDTGKRFPNPSKEKKFFEFCFDAKDVTAL